jgi:hypothetical protein
MCNVHSLSDLATGIVVFMPCMILRIHATLCPGPATEHSSLHMNKLVADSVQAPVKAVGFPCR